MPDFTRFRVIVPLVVLVLAVVPRTADAQSRRDLAAAETLNQRMQAAETRYREAVVRIGNADPEAQAQSDAALEDMEDVITACARQRGCSLATMLTSYKRLLKAQADAEGPVDGTELADPVPADPMAAEPDHSVIAQGAAADVPEAARAAALLADEGHDFDRMVQYNPAVQEAIRRWLTDMRSALMTSHENYQHMRHLMWPHYQRAELPEALLFGIMAKESHGRVHSTSRAGAAGPMQFMYATGKRFGLGEDGTGFDTRYDAFAAAEASVAYLNERLRELDGSIEMSLAAYNGGEGRARRIHRASGGKDFWDESVYRQFPPETRDYVPMVIAAAWLYLHPKQYGLEFPEVDPRPAAITLEQPSSIYQLTICLGNGGTRDGFMRVLRNLNPRYDADDVIAAGTPLDATRRIAGLYHRWCTRGPRAELARTLVNSDPGAAVVRAGSTAPATAAKATATAATAATAPRQHRVRRGETLSSIARRFQCSAGDLAENNAIEPPRYPIRQGQVLSLKGCENQSTP